MALADGEVPAFLVAYDVTDRHRHQWEGTDIVFGERAAAAEFLAERLRTWPEYPFRVYGLVPLPATTTAAASAGEVVSC